MVTSLAAGPVALGLRLGADVRVDDDGWLCRDLIVPVGLDGPPGILQGGLAAGVTAAIARAVDRFGAPLTSVDARLHAPTPLGATATARARALDGVGRSEVEVRAGERLLVSAEVELAGQDPPPLGLDLLELATVPLPEAVPQHDYPTCVVCGPEPVHPQGMRLHPRPASPGTVVIPWVPEGALGAAGLLDPVVVAAVLDCPTVWAAMGELRSHGYVGALLAGFRLQLFGDAPTLEPLRTVARLDVLDGRKVRARSALVDEEGTIYALASALHIAVTEIPSLTPSS